MAKRGGYTGGMPGNMNNMIRQAQRMQRQMEEREKALAEAEYAGTAGGGAVSVTLSGLKELKKVHIDPDVMDPDDAETLEELIMMAYRDAASQIEASLGESGGLGGLSF